VDIPIGTILALIGDFKSGLAVGGWGLLLKIDFHPFDGAAGGDCSQMKSCVTT
jgi:hypothetical protein